MPDPIIQRLADALSLDQLPEALLLLKQLGGMDIVMGWIDDVDPVLYVAHRLNGRVHGAAVLVEDEALQVYQETQSPPFTRCAPEVILELDPTLDARAIAWRRDCMLRHHRSMAVNARLSTPPWTAFYSEQPLAYLQHPAHFAVVARSSNGRAGLAITDGERQRILDEPDPALTLWALPQLEWWQHRQGLLAAKGRSELHYIGIGPLEYRVGMLFNDIGGLLAWSPCAQDCQVMAALAGGAEDVFTPRQLLQQLDGWLGRSSVTERPTLRAV